MSYKVAFRQVMRDYEISRTRADALLEERRAQVYQSVPRVGEIDKELGVLGASLVRSALGGDVSVVDEIRRDINRLKEERLLLLEGFGDLNAVYGCEICSDTGYIQATLEQPGVRCSCLKQRLINEYYSLSNVKEILQDENFDTYDLRLFSDRLIESEGFSPLVNMEQIYRLTTQFVEDFDKEFSNLLLYGGTGLGKTFVCHCIAKDLLDRGRTVLYLTAPRLCKVIEDYRFNRESLTEPDEMLDAVDDVDLLILDDLGAEVSTVVTSAALFDIINQRLISRKHTVISTNLTPTALAVQYSERIVSRFFGSYQIIKFFGEDIRVKKKYGGLRM